MPGPDMTAQLPPELLLQIFDWLFLPELARLLTVSRRWRAIVMDHPTYFAHPVLDDPSPSAVAFFLARFNPTARKPWDVWVTVHEPFPLLETCIFPAIAPLLCDLEALTIHVHISHAPAVFELLRGSATSLYRLQLFFATESDDSGVVVLPEDILPDRVRSEGLNTLLLENVAIPARVPPFLARARNVVFGVNLPNAPTSLHDLARAFPVIRDLTLNNNAVDNVSGPSSWPPQWDYLDSLMISVPRRRLRHVVAALPLSRTAHLTTMHTGNRAVQLIIAHVQGPLDLSIQEINDKRFVIHLTSRTSRRVRSFYELKEKWTGPSPVPHRLLSCPALLERISSFVIPATLWNTLVPQMAECSNLKNVTLLLPGSIWRSQLFSGDAPPPRPIFPSLRVLTLVGEYGISVVTPQDVSRIVLERLLPQRPLRLFIHDVTWTGAAHVSPVIDSVHLAESIDPRNLYPTTPWHV